MRRSVPASAPLDQRGVVPIVARRLPWSRPAVAWTGLTATFLAVGATGFALAKDADDEKVPAAEVTKIEETLSTLGCSGYESVKKEEQGI